MSFLVGFAHQVPANIIDNDCLEQRLHLTPGWMERRTGFRARRYCETTQSTGDLAIQSAQKSLQLANVSPEQIGMVIVATSTPDHPLPGTAPMLAGRLGISAPAFDLMAACTGFLYGLAIADNWVERTGQPVLVVGANKLSYRVNPDDAQTVGLFGDGAGSVVLTADPQGLPGMRMVAQSSGNQGQYWQQLYIPAGGSRQPLDRDVIQTELRYMKMESGRQVFKLAVESMQQHCQSLLDQQQLTIEDLRWLIPHQASRRIVSELGRRLGLPEERCAWWLGDLGNSSAATIPIALSLGWNDQQFQAEDIVLLAAAGAGMCSAATLLQVSPTKAKNNDANKKVTKEF